MLPYSIEVLFALHDQFNREAWLVALISHGLALLLLILLILAPGGAKVARIISFLMASIWAWMGIGFYFLQFAPYNFAAPFYGGLCLLQALLFIWAGYKARPRYGGAQTRAAWIGWGLLIYALAFSPLLDMGLGQTTRLFAMAPGPTVLFTMGLLLLTRDRTPYLLLIIPLLWGFLQGGQAWVLGLPQDAILPLASLAEGVWMVWRQREERRDHAS